MAFLRTRLGITLFSFSKSQKIDQDGLPLFYYSSSSMYFGNKIAKSSRRCVTVLFGKIVVKIHFIRAEIFDGNRGQ